MQESNSIEGMFPAMAMPDAAWWQALWPQPEKALADIGIEPGMDVVDLCCGDGLFTVPLAKMARRVIAVDLDPEMINLARARVAAVKATNCVFIVGDAYDLAALIANTFHGVPDKQRLARAVAAVLRPGGRLSVIKWHRRLREETVVLGQAVRRTGVIQRESRSPPGPRTFGRVDDGSRALPGGAEGE